ncbi:MAG: Kelch repeat-containing protein, partial [Acidimicrobiia bacterium]
ADDYLYVFGGASNDPFTGNISLAARYAPTTNSWSAVEGLPTGRSGMAAVYYDGEIWLIGGFGPAGDSLASVLIYDIATNTCCSNGPSLPSPRDHAGAIVIDGELLVFGGRKRNGGTEEPTSVVRLTSSDDKTWSSSGLEAMPRARRSFVIGTAEGKVQLFGGESQGAETIDEVDEFDPVTGEWSTSLPAMPTGRHGPAGATIGPSTFVVGGSLEMGAAKPTDVNERFTR